MRKIGIFLIIIGLFSFALLKIFDFQKEKEAEKQINEYIEITSIEEDQEEPIVEDEPIKKEDTKNSLNYVAILEIPVINLKTGMVEATDNFKSINYAVSIDKSSQYPDIEGNMIIYSHSGNSRIAFFKHLNQVKIGDSVYVYFRGIRYEYKIFTSYEIEKVGKLNVTYPKDKRHITLVTCNPNKKGFQIVLVGEQINQEKY